MKAFVRILNPGSVRIGQIDAEVFVEVDWSGSRLSIMGVEGPKRNGDAHGACGQIPEHLSRLEAIDMDWTLPRIERLRAIWERWHLNDMRAGCIHQREAWNPSVPGLRGEE